MKTLLTLEAFIEIAAGAGALVVPVFAVSLLLGSTLENAAAVIVARVTGAALITIGMMNWAGRGEPNGRVAKGLVAGMVFYNVAVVGLFVYACFGAGLSGIGLWPAVVLHVGMAAWCLASIRRRFLR
ncbi:MAG: hypothetical protein JNK16_09360 [Phycisphaerales bacterium]|nr:hypothetical protein [Phycisphaerales bacterium]